MQAVRGGSGRKSTAASRPGQKQQSEVQLRLHSSPGEVPFDACVLWPSTVARQRWALFSGREGLLEWTEPAARPVVKCMGAKSMKKKCRYSEKRLGRLAPMDRDFGRSVPRAPRTLGRPVRARWSHRPRCWKRQSTSRESPQRKPWVPASYAGVTPSW